MPTIHTQDRLDTEMAKAEDLAAQWIEAYVLGKPLGKIEAALDAAIRATRRTESYLKKHP